MYERSAMVLERQIEKMLNLNKEYNVKRNYENYKELIEEIEKYHIITTKEAEIIKVFDETVKKIENIQKEQEKIYKVNLKLEESRNKLFYDLDEDVPFLENRFQKIEANLDKDNEQLKEIRLEFIKSLAEFSEKQKERVQCEKTKRIGEAEHIKCIEKITEELKNIEENDILNLKKFIKTEKEELIKEVNNVMLKNGKSEKVPFDKDILLIAVQTRIDIALREAECYGIIYDKIKKLLSESDNENLNIEKYKKVLKSVSVKLNFLNSEKEYIVSLLDYERMTAISGEKAHKKMMEEARSNFESDIQQIENLYQLILREIAGKSTKKAYKELYNKTYLKNIEDKERNFEEEVNNIKINMGTVINSNYWRIDGIKNIYEVFQNEVSENFGKDLSEYRIEEIEEQEDVLIKQEKSKEEENNFEEELFKENEDENKGIFFGDEEDDEDDEDLFEDEDNDEDIYEEDDTENDEEELFEEDEDEESFYEENDEEIDEDYDEDEFEDESEEDEFYDEEDDEDDDDEFYDEEDDDDLEDVFEEEELEEEIDPYDFGFIEDDELEDDNSKEEGKKAKKSLEKNKKKKEKSEKKNSKKQKNNKPQKEDEYNDEHKEVEGIFNKLFGEKKRKIK